MNVLLIILMLAVGFISANDNGKNKLCDGRASIVFALPMSSKFSTLTIYLEDFLLQLVKYFQISEFNFKISILEYGRTSRMQTKFSTTRKLANTEISTMGSRRPVEEANEIFLKPVLEDAVRSLNTTSEMYRVKVIVLILNENVLDVESTSIFTNLAKESGIIFYVVTSYSGSLEAALSISTDVCKAFVVSDFKTGLDDVITDLGNNICLVSVFDPSLSVMAGPDTLGNCNIDTVYQPPETELTYFCRKDGLFPDLLNCAYFYKCTRGRSVHLKCEYGNVFDANTQTCNHKMAVTCYSGITCPGETGLFPYPGDCYKFLNCFKGMPYIQECPHGLVFDKLVKRCLVPINALC